jgi:peptidoglycan/LPS O-acetylase OafA/YrhL
VLLFAARSDKDWYWRGGFAVVPVLFVLVIVRALQPGRFHNLLGFSGMVWVGRISYGLYLWHYPIWFAVRSRFPSLGNVPVSVLSTALTAGVATASFRWVEQPIRLAVAARYGIHRRRASGAPASVAT